MADYRNVWALIAAVMCIQLGAGVLNVVAPLGLSQLGASPVMIGLIAGLHAIGYMAGAQIATESIRTFGNIRVFSAAAAIGTISILMMNLFSQVGPWALVRLLQGVALALMFSSIEAWLGSAVPERSRGRVNGLYHVVAKAALIVGPFIVAGLAATDPHPITWAAVFLAMASLPICLARHNQPPRPEKVPMSMLGLYALAPAAVIAVFISGVMNTGVLSLLPLFAQSGLGDTSGGQTQLAALATAAVWSGGLVSQWPAGRLSDHQDRRVVIAILGLTCTLASLGLIFDLEWPGWIILTLLFFWGAGALSFYAVAVSHAIDRAPAGQIAQVMAGLLFIWAVGSVIGPLLAGAAMRTPFGPGGLFIFSAILGALLVISMLWRRASREKTRPDEHMPWNPAMPTLAPKGDMDPRAD